MKPKSECDIIEFALLISTKCKHVNEMQFVSLM